MHTALAWAGDDDEAPSPVVPCSRVLEPLRAPRELPRSVAAAIWRGNELGSPVSSVVRSGFAALDAELPGGGWPCHSLTELLQPQPTIAEWRLLCKRPGITS